MKMISHSLWQRVVGVFLVAGFLCACEATDPQLQIEKADYQLYNEAMNKMYEGEYRSAAELFNEIERQHPYSNWAVKGQVMAAFCYYQVSDYDEVVIGVDRFVNLNPNNPDVPYAQYLKAMSYFEQVRDVSRDQSNSEQALKAFQELTRRFPENTYAKDSVRKIDLLIDHLAGKDMEVGRYYQKRDYHLAAIKRYRSVIEEYDMTIHIPEALYRMVESYLSLGMVLEARKMAAVLGYNHPNDEWYRDAYRLLEDNGLLEGHSDDMYRQERRANFDEEGYLEYRNQKGLLDRAWSFLGGTSDEESPKNAEPPPQAPEPARSPPGHTAPTQADSPTQTPSNQ